MAKFVSLHRTPLLCYLKCVRFLAPAGTGAFPFAIRTRLSSATLTPMKPLQDWLDGIRARAAGEALLNKKTWWVTLLYKLIGDGKLNAKPH